MNTFLVILFVVVAVFGLVYSVGYAFSGGSTHIVVKEKWVKYHDSDAKYLVSSVDGEVYEITDSWVRMRWDSSDLYAYLQSNMSCNIVYQGWRAPFFSDYKNIISADCGGN
jgi:hypothetical protein